LDPSKTRKYKRFTKKILVIHLKSNDDFHGHVRECALGSVGVGVCVAILYKKSHYEGGQNA
jgi:hypothetical protein